MIKKNNPTLNPADVALLIGAMKVVFPTRDEVVNIVKEEIKFLPTTDEMNKRLSQLLTTDEMIRRFSEFPTHDEVAKIVEEKTKLLPTRDEFFARMDKLSGEYKKIDEAETLHDGEIGEHTDTLEKHEGRIKALEDRHKSTPTPIAA